MAPCCLHLDEWASVVGSLRIVFTITGALVGPMLISTDHELVANLLLVAGILPGYERVADIRKAAAIELQLIIIRRRVLPDRYELGRILRSARSFLIAFTSRISAPEFVLLSAPIIRAQTSITVAKLADRAFLTQVPILTVLEGQEECQRRNGIQVTNMRPNPSLHTVFSKQLGFDDGSNRTLAAETQGPNC